MHQRLCPHYHTNEAESVGNNSCVCSLWSSRVLGAPIGEITVYPTTTLKLDERLFHSLGKPNCVTVRIYGEPSKLPLTSKLKSLSFVLCDVVVKHAVDRGRHSLSVDCQSPRPRDSYFLHIQLIEAPVEIIHRGFSFPNRKPR